MKKYLVILIIIFLGVLFILNITGFCFRQGEYISKEHYPPRKDYIISYLAEHGMAKKIYDDPSDNRQYSYDENDLKNITRKVNAFFKENSQNMKINRYKIFDTSEAYSSYLVYFFSPNEIEVVNKNIHNKNFNKLKREIIGIAYWKSYSSCGHPTFGIKTYVYQGDRVDLELNPYRKDKDTK